MEVCSVTRAEQILLASGFHIDKGVIKSPKSINTINYGYDTQEEAMSCLIQEWGYHIEETL